MKAHPTPLPLRILTHNIRYATSSPFPGEKPWAQRKDLIVNQLRYHTTHVPEAFVCLQEVLHGQLGDVLEGLNSRPVSALEETEGSKSKSKEEEDFQDNQQWAYIGVGRDDGLTAGEYSPILYRPRVWSLTRWSTVWLSPTPSVPSKGWDAASIRIATVGHFVHRASGKRVVGLSTHFDEQGPVSRVESARIVLRIIEDVKSENEDVHVFLAGDLNSEADDAAYQLLNGAASPIADSKGRARWTYGAEKTCTGFRDEEMTVIDYVFLGTEGWAVEGYSVLPNRFEEGGKGVYCSDHRAVVVDAYLD